MTEHTSMLMAPPPPTPLEQDVLQAIFGCMSPDLRPMSLSVETTGLGGDNLVVSVATLTPDPILEAFDAELVTIDWTQDPSVDQTWLTHRIQKTRDQICNQGGCYDVSIEKMKSRGLPPLQAATAISHRLERLASSSVLLINYVNLLGSLEATIDRIKPAWSMPDFGTILDLCAVEKAIQIGVKPGPQDNLTDFGLEVLSYRAGSRTVKFSLHHHSNPKYLLDHRLRLRYGQDPNTWPVLMRNCYLLQELYQVYRERSQEKQ